MRDQGAFHVSNEDYERFQVLYREAAMSGAYLNVMERPKKFSMLCVDVDLRYTIETTRFSEISHARHIHDLVQKEVRKSFIVDDIQTIAGFLFQKPKLKASNMDGFHLMYPSLIMEVSAWRDVLTALNEYIKHKRIFTDLPLDVDNWQDIIDTNVIKAFCLLLVAVKWEECHTL